MHGHNRQREDLEVFVLDFALRDGLSGKVWFISGDSLLVMDIQNQFTSPVRQFSFQEGMLLNVSLFPINFMPKVVFLRRMEDMSKDYLEYRTKACNLPPSIPFLPPHI